LFAIASKPWTRDNELDLTIDDELLKEMKMDLVDLEGLLNAELGDKADWQDENLMESLNQEPQTIKMSYQENDVLDPNNKNLNTDMLSVSLDSSNMAYDFTENPLAITASPDDKITSFGTSNKDEYQLPIAVMKTQSVLDTTTTFGVENLETFNGPEATSTPVFPVSMASINIEENFPASQFEEIRINQAIQEELLATKSEQVLADNVANPLQEVVAKPFGELDDEQNLAGHQSEDTAPLGDLETSTSPRQDTKNDKTEQFPSTTDTSMDSESTIYSLVNSKTTPNGNVPDTGLRQAKTRKYTGHGNSADGDFEIEITYYTDDVDEFFKKEEILPQGGIPSNNNADHDNSPLTRL